MTTRQLASPRVLGLRRRVRWIVAATITYNVVEAVVAIMAGAAASSTALIGFGLDSIVEVLSAAAVAWQFARPDPHEREHLAMRVIAVSFFALAAYVTAQAVWSLAGAAPEESVVGIGLAAASLVVMPLLSWLERRTGRALGSASVVADSKQTLLCAWLSAVVLVGLLLNAALGWVWADPIAGLAIAGVAIREGRDALRGDACCTPTSALFDSHTGDPAVEGCTSACTDACCT